MNDMNEAGRTFVEKAITQRLKRSNRFQRAMAATALVAGVGTGVSIYRDSEAVGVGSTAVVAAGSVAAIAERRKALQTLDTIVLAYARYYHTTMPSTPDQYGHGNPWLRSEITITNHGISEEKRVDYQAIPRLVDGNMRFVQAGSSPFLLYLGVTLGGELAAGKVTPEATTPIGIMAGVFVLAATGMHAGTEWDSNHLQHAYQRQLNNIEGINFTTAGD